MKTMQNLLQTFFVIQGMAALLFAPQSLAAEMPSYTVGVVPQFDSRRIIATWQPILERVGQEAGIRLELKASPSIPSFEGGLTQGDFDFAYMNPYHLLVANRSQGYRPLLRDHGSDLEGIVVVRKDSSITEVAALQGKVVAFPAPNALGASLMVRAELQGERKIAIEPRYVKNHTSVYLNVATGVASAGGGVQETLNQQPPEVQEQLRIIYRTTKVAPHPLAAHPRVPAKVVERLQRAMLALGQSEEGRKLLDDIPIKQVGKASLDDYMPLKRMGLEEYYVKE